MNWQQEYVRYLDRLHTDVEAEAPKDIPFMGRVGLVFGTVKGHAEEVIRLLPGADNFLDGSKMGVSRVRTLATIKAAEKAAKKARKDARKAQESRYQEPVKTAQERRRSPSGATGSKKFSLASVGV